MSQDREDLLRIAADLLQERGIKLDEAELQRLLGVAPPRAPSPFEELEHLPEPKWPPLDNGTVVRTRLRNPPTPDWTKEASRSRHDNVLGVIVGYHDSHGLTYEVRHSFELKPLGWLQRTFLSPYALIVRERQERQRQIGHYEADELVVVPGRVPPRLGR